MHCSPRSPTGPRHQLRSALDQLVASELVFRHGVPPDATYTFKHALVQDAAYASLLKSRREQLHARIARVLEERFPETAATQPELLAQHYTAAGLYDQAVDYWHRAGQRASERSADLEAIAPLPKDSSSRETLPDPTQAAHRELKLQVALGEPLVAAKGSGAPEVGATYARALELCRQVGETPQLFPTMWGLWHFYCGQGAFHTARDLGQSSSSRAEQDGDPMLLVAAHQALGQSLYRLGEFEAALIHLEQARAGLDPKLDRSPHLRYGIAPACAAAWLAWHSSCGALAIRIKPWQRQSRSGLARAPQMAHTLNSLNSALFYCDPVAPAPA